MLSCHTIKITDFNRWNFFLNVGDVEMRDPPPITKGCLLFGDFSYPFDLQRLSQVLKDGGVVEDSLILESLEYLKSIKKNSFDHKKILSKC